MHKIIITLFTAVLAIPAHAYYKESVKTCLSIPHNSSNAQFIANFKSSDVFDYFGHSTHPIKSGENCQSHVYKNGPKWLTFTVKANASHVNKVKINPDRATCPNYYNVAPGEVTMQEEKDVPRYIRQNFNLIEVKPEGRYSHVFEMRCNNVKTRD